MPATGRHGAGAHVLLVDDDPKIQDVAARALEERGLVVSRASTASDARARLRAGGVDLVVLDIELGAESGLDLLRDKDTHAAVPVILLTGRASEVDRVIGFELGAVDYVVKPFYARELAARVAVHLPRPEPSARLEAGRLAVDLDAREALVDGRAVALTAQELDLLASLVRGGRRVQTREQLLLDAWSSSAAWQTTATVTEHVRRVRLKLAGAGLDPDAIVAIRGAGYRLDAERWS